MNLHVNFCFYILFFNYLLKTVGKFKLMLAVGEYWLITQNFQECLAYHETKVPNCKV